MEIKVTVTVPVLNEEESLAALVERLTTTMSRVGIEQWEMIFVLDGCTDGSLQVLQEARREDHRVRILELSSGIGQHAALYEGLRRARGEFLVTLDADLQNPPEEIPHLVEALQQGYEAVGTIRLSRSDRWFRGLASAIFAKTLKGVGIRHVLRDPGCMLRAWRRDVFFRFVATGEPAIYLPLQLNRLAESYREFETRHDSRAAGTSRYTPISLGRLFSRALLAQLAPQRVAQPEITAATFYGDDHDEPTGD